MMKSFLCLSLPLVYITGAVAGAPALPTATVPAYSPDWDPDLAPTTRQTLTTVVARNANSATTLFKMIEKSKTNRLGDVALQAVGALCQKHPDKADVLAAYCWGYVNQIDMLYVPKARSGYRERTLAEQAIFEQRFEKCKKINPIHWLFLLTEGHEAYAGPRRERSRNYSVAFAKFKRAFEVAPNDKYVRSMCLIKRASAYNMAANNKYIYRDKPVSFRDSAAIFEEAGRLDARQSGTWLTLYLIYSNDLNDIQNARRVGQLFLKTLPPEQKTKSNWAVRIAKDLQQTL